MCIVARQETTNDRKVYVVIRRNILLITVLYCTVLYCTVLYRSVLYRTIQIKQTNITFCFNCCGNNIPQRMLAAPIEKSH